MRYLLCAIALATVAGSGLGQQPRQSANTTALSPLAAMPMVAECYVTISPRPASQPIDSLCVSRADAIAGALVANPQLLVAGAQAQQARASRVQAVALPDPVFGAEWGGASAPFGIGGSNSRVVGAALTVPFVNTFGLHGRIGTAGIRQSESDSVAVRQSIASQTSQTYDALLAALRHRSNGRQADSLAVDFLQKTQARFEAGTVARLDVVNAEVAVAQAGNELIAIERDIANARASLNRLLGRPLGAPLATADTLGLPAALPPLQALEAAALRDRPELGSLAQQQLAAHATTTLSQEFWFPNLTIGVIKDFLGGTQPGYLTTGISFPIPILYRNHANGEIAQAKSYETELAARYRDLQAAVAEDVRFAYTAAGVSLRQAAYIRDQLLPASRQAYRIAAASYALGGSSALEVNAARVALISAASQYTDALAAANSARADLERAVASPLATFGTGVPQ